MLAHAVFCHGASRGLNNPNKVSAESLAYLILWAIVFPIQTVVVSTDNPDDINFLCFPTTNKSDRARASQSESTAAWVRSCAGPGLGGFVQTFPRERRDAGPTARWSGSAGTRFPPAQPLVAARR
jgi:hypothetical protein